MQVAADLMRREGTGATTLERVARDAGLRERALRRMFGDVEALRREVFALRPRSEVADLIAGAAASPGPRHCLCSSRPPIASSQHPRRLGLPRIWKPCCVREPTRGLREVAEDRLGERLASLRLLIARSAQDETLDRAVSQAALTHYLLAFSVGLSMIDPVAASRPAIAEWDGLIAPDSASGSGSVQLGCLNRSIRTWRPGGASEWILPTCPGRSRASSVRWGCWARTPWRSAWRREASGGAAPTSRSSPRRRFPLSAARGGRVCREQRVHHPGVGRGRPGQPPAGHSMGRRTWCATPRRPERGRGPGGCRPLRGHRRHWGIDEHDELLDLAQERVDQLAPLHWTPGRQPSIPPGHITAHRLRVHPRQPSRRMGTARGVERFQNLHDLPVRPLHSPSGEAARGGQRPERRPGGTASVRTDTTGPGTRKGRISCPRRGR